MSLVSICRRFDSGNKWPESLISSRFVIRGDFCPGSRTLEVLTSADLGAGSAPWPPGRLVECKSLLAESSSAVFGRQSRQSPMCLSKEVLKGKCRRQPNVDPASAYCDHGADL